MPLRNLRSSYETVSMRYLEKDKENLLWLLNHAFLILTLSARSDILEVLANVFGKMKCAWVLPLKNSNQLTK